MTTDPSDRRDEEETSEHDFGTPNAGPAHVAPPGTGWQPPSFAPPGTSAGGQRPQPPSQGWTPQSWDHDYGRSAHGSSGIAAAAGVSLIVLAILIVLTFGSALLFYDVLLELEDVPLDPFEERVVPVILGGGLVLAVAQLIAGIGVLAHQQWARIVGAVIAVIGLLLGGLLGTDGLASGAPDVLTMAALAVGGYGLALFGLIAGGAHFVRRS